MTGPFEFQASEEAAQQAALAVEALDELVSTACSLKEPWPEKVAVVVEGALRFASERPRSARALILEAPVAGAATLEQRSRCVERLALALSSGRLGEGVDALELPPLTEQLLVGAALSVVGQRLLGGEDGALVELSSQLVELILLPYLGAQEARVWARSRGGSAGGEPDGV